MASDEIVNPMRSLSNKRWQVFQLLGPVLGVLLVIGAIGLVTLHSYHTTREGAILLSNSLLKSEQRYITQEARNYLSPAISSSVVANDMLNRDSYEQNAETFMLLGRSILRNVPQVESFYLADGDGHFSMMARREGVYEETNLRVENGRQVYRHNLVDSEGRFLRTDSLDAGDYDPRTSPWYTGAERHAERASNRIIDASRLYWTDPYPYFSTRQYIITASVAFKTVTGKRVVFAINISLNQMTKFVNSLKVGKSGQAVIVDMQGHVIAGHNTINIGQEGFDPTTARLDPKTQPVFTRALNIFRVKGDGAGLIRARGKNFVTIASAMPLAKRSWVLLLNAPEEDFASFAHVVQQQTISFSLIIVGLASVLAVALIYQGRRVLSYQKRLVVGEEEARRENVAMLKVAHTPGLLDVHTDIPVLSEVLAERAGAKRASIWRILPDGERMICEDMFDRTRDVHGSGIELTEMAHPALFSILAEEQIVDIADAAQDPRFRGIQRVVMRSVEARHLYIAPVLERHQLLGMIMLEDPRSNGGMERIVALCSSVMAVRFLQLWQEEEVRDGKSDDHLSGQDRARALDIPEGRHFSGRLEGGPDHQRQLRVHESMGFLLPLADGNEPPATGLYPHIPLMILEFSEAYREETGAAKILLALIQQLAEKIQLIADEAGLFSMQIAGSRVIFLGSCSLKPDPVAVLRLADAAIKMRETCLMAIAGNNTRLMFRIGMDIGPVMAAHFGNSPGIFNIWGEALGVAELLARSAPDGGQIQVSQTVHQELRGDFLFRSRGNFYFPGSGIMRSYILAGRR